MFPVFSDRQTVKEDLGRNISSRRLFLGLKRCCIFWSVANQCWLCNVDETTNYQLIERAIMETVRLFMMKISFAPAILSYFELSIPFHLSTNKAMTVKSATHRDLLPRRRGFCQPSHSRSRTRSFIHGRKNSGRSGELATTISGTEGYLKTLPRKKNPGKCVICDVRMRRNH